MKVLIIDNLQDNAETRKRLRDALRRHFPAARLDYVIHDARAGTPLAAVVRLHVRDGVGLVVAAGGDGTVSAVCDGLRGSSVPLGIIPAGTGNLVARELDIPLDLDAAVALLAGPHQTRIMDAMRIGDRAYVLNISVGISAAIIEGTSGQSKRWLGRVAYIGTALREVLLFRRRQLVVEVDGRSHPYRALDVAIMNCGLLGAQLYPRGPKIWSDDGALGVWILSMKTPADYMRYIFGVLAGRRHHPLAKFISAQRTVHIRSGDPLSVQADGDIIGSTPIEVTVLPGALTVWVPVAGAPPRTRLYPANSLLAAGAKQGFKDRLSRMGLRQLLHPFPHLGKSLWFLQQTVDFVRKRDDIRRAYGHALLKHACGIDLFLPRDWVQEDHRQGTRHRFR